MKKLLIGLLALGSVSAFSFHPGDEERLINIGTGAQLKVIEDINIVPNRLLVELGEQCMLRLVEKKSFDRVLTTGSVLTITQTDGGYKNADIIRVDNNNIESVFCYSKDGVKPTIGDLKESTGNLLEVILAEPVKI